MFHIWTALILWVWIPDSAAMEIYVHAFGAIYDVDPNDALAVAWIEGKHRRNPTSSHRPDPWSPAHPWRICGAYQVTGGRYGRPACSLMVSWLWVGTWAGVASIYYWRGRCARTWACAYHQGNAGCRVDGCQYMRRMKRLARQKPWEGLQWQRK